MLILASQSPRRVALLGLIGLDTFQIYPAMLDESAQAGELPHHMVKRLARLKAEKVFTQTNGYGDKRIILAADTLVSMGRRVIEAPHNPSDAQRCLDRLSGRSHCVHTSVVVLCATHGLRQKCVQTRVFFKVLSQEEKQAYVKSGEGLGKAGGYSIQGFAGAFVKRINGSWSSVVGLPLLETRSLLMNVGIPIWPPMGGPEDA